MNAGASGTSDYRRWGLLANSDNVLYREECVGTSNCTTNSLMSYAAGAWYRAWLTVDSSNVFKVKVWRIDTPSTNAEHSVAHSDWSGMEWKFKDFSISGTQYFDNYQQSLLYGKGMRTKMVDNSTNTRAGAMTGGGR